MITCARAGGSSPAYRFPSSCIPSGWRTASDSECDKADCSRLNEEDCENSERCTEIKDTDGVYRGCMPSDMGCPAVITCGTEDGANYVEYPSGCLPQGTYEVPSTACTDPCTSLSESECSETSSCLPIQSSDGVYRGCAASVPSVAPPSCAANGNYEVAYFTSAPPIGWYEVDGVCQDEIKCSKQLTNDACLATEGCMPLMGLLNGFHYCTSSKACGEAETCATRSGGAYDVFTTTCIPPAWAEAGGTCPVDY